MEVNFFDDFIKARSMQSLFLTRISLWWAELEFIYALLVIGAVTALCAGMAALSGAAILGGSIGFLISGFMAVVLNAVSDEIHELKESTRVLQEKMVSDEMEVRKTHLDKISPALTKLTETNSYVESVSKDLAKPEESADKLTNSINKASEVLDAHKTQIKEVYSLMDEVDKLLEANSANVHITKP